MCRDRRLPTRLDIARLERIERVAVDFITPASTCQRDTALTRTITVLAPSSSACRARTASSIDAHENA